MNKLDNLISLNMFNIDKFRNIEKKYRKILAVGRDNMFNSLKKDDILCLVGVGGGNGRMAFDFLQKKDIEVSYFYDNNPKLTTFYGNSVHRPEHIKSLSGNVKIIIASMHYLPIIKQLEGLGLLENILGILCNPTFFNETLLYNNYDKIERVYSFLKDDISKNTLSNILQHRIKGDYNYIFDIYEEKDQYFAEDIITFIENEVFIDCGAYVGDTLQEFVHKTNKTYKKIIALEPDMKSYLTLLDFTKNLQDSRIEVFNAGAYSSSKKQSFNMNLGVGSHIVESNSDSSNEYFIDTVSIDNFIDEEISFIKMDIEGSELSALKGCKNTILRSKPKLAISIYHKEDDLWEIPLYIQSLRDDYKFYIRHYSTTCGETVFYAI